MKVAINESLDLAKSSNTSIPLSYKLLDSPQDMLKSKSDTLEEMFFCFRNNNKLMLTLIDNCPHDKNQYETLSHFLVHNFYENIFNSTFVQEDMMVLIYLLLEQLIDRGNVKDGNGYLGGSFVYEMFRSLALKEDIRAYLTVILNKVVAKIEKIAEGVLTVDAKEIEEGLKEKTLLMLNMVHSLHMTHKNDEFEMKMTPEEYIKSQNVTLKYLKDCLSDIEKDVSKYTKEEKDFITANITYVQNKGEHIINNDELLKDIANKEKAIQTELVLNINKITFIVNMIISNLLENISTIPYTIKCICKIIHILISDKYKSSLNDFNKLIYTITFFFECILIPSLLNPDHNGVITNSIISSNVRKSLHTITTILHQITKGTLFTSETKYTVFNMFIINIIPNVIKLFKGIRSTKLPTALEKLITYKGNANRDIDYHYFKHNHTENITHQSICFNWENVLTFIKILKKHKEKFIAIVPEMKNVFDKVVSYENDFVKWVASDMQGIVKEVKGVSFKIKEIKFAYYGRVIFKEEFKAILEGKKTSQSNISINNAFSFTSNLANVQNVRKTKSKEKNEYEEEFKKKRNDSLIAHFKKSLCEILQYINIISKENLNIFDINEETDSFDKSLLPNIINMIKYEISNNNDNFYKNKDKNIPVIYFITFLERNINNIPESYKKDNYSLLCSELLRESEQSLQNAKNDVINQIYLKVKNSDKLNMIINNSVFQMKQMEKIITVENLVNILNVVVKLEYQKTGDKIVNISLNKNDTNSYPEDTISSIPSFIELFPSFAEIKENDPIDYEESLQVDKILNRYFTLIKQTLKSNERMLRYSYEEFNSVNEEIQNYIMSKIHDRLVPYKRTKKDIFIHNKCKRLQWVKPHHLIKDQKVVNENLWQLAMEYINNMDNEKTPSAKIKCFNKAFAILQNSITFCTGKDELGVDDSLQVLIYVIIKAQPKRIWTNFNYARLFIDPELSKKQFGLLLTQLEMVLTVIKDLKYTDLVDVTEEEFGKDEKIDEINIDNDEY